MSDKFYPQLSNIVSLDSLPEQLSFIEGGLQQILSNLHYRNYQVSQSSDKITTTRNLELVSFEGGPTRGRTFSIPIKEAS